MAVKLLMMFLFFAIMIGVGIYAKTKAKSVGDFVLGGNTAGPWLTAFSYGTSYFSAVIFVGYAGQFGWKFGVASTWIGLGNAFIGSLLAWLVLGRRTRIMTNHLNSATMPDFFGKRYDSKALRIAASIIAFVFLIPYTASVYNGLSRLFEMAFKIDYKYCILIMAALTGVYVILGGYMATTINDFIQGIIMLFGISAVVISVLNGQGGFYSALTKLSEVPVDASAPIQGQGVYNSFFGSNPMDLLSVIILTSLGTWGLPQMVHKFYAIKNEKSIKTGAIVSTAFAVIVAGGCYFLGGFSRLFHNADIYGDNGTVLYDAIIPEMLRTLPDLLIGVVVVLVLSASMSTLSSLVLTSASTVTLDIVKGNIIKKMSEKTQLFVLRLFLLFFVTLSVIIAWNKTTLIASLMGISWGALAGAFLAPFMYGLYSKKVTKLSVWASFFTGVGITVAGLLISTFHGPITVGSLTLTSPIVTGALAMIAGLVVVPLVSLITPKPSKEKVEEIFTCYNKVVAVPKKMYLEEEEDDNKKENKED
ncbi:MAG: sodium:solute symporter [Lachnospiraceae bacterium]|nr:sodium:solute symporter [Lachnospiraceae bacterium]